MANSKSGTKQTLMEAMQQEASRLILRAMASPKKVAQAEWINAADCEDRVACILETEGRDLESAVHRFSAASCYARAERYADAVTFARSALSFPLNEAQREEIGRFLKQWLGKAKKQLRQQARSKQPVATS